MLVNKYNAKITMNEDVEQLQQDANDENTIKQEYKLWRENCKYMYEFISETALKWPSITVQWLPQHETKKSDHLFEASILLGTHTEGNDQNYLKLANTQIPMNQKDNKVNSRIKIFKKFDNEYEINRARCMPQDSNVVATINGGGQVDIYDLNGLKQPIHHLTNHSENGYGLSWNPLTKGYLSSGSDDKTVLVYDMNKQAEIITTIKGHQDIVNDVKWNNFNQHLLASVSDDKYLNIYDIRNPVTPAVRFYNETSNGINCISFSPFSTNLIAVGNADSNINILDFRQLSSQKSNAALLHTMMGHSDAITCMEFSPTKDGIIASGSQDRRLMIWDLSKIGEEQAQEDAEDGCPELFMMHAGHTGGVTDLSWCPYKDWTLSSVADDNIVHVWEISKTLLTEGFSEDIHPEELE